MKMESFIHIGLILMAVLPLSQCNPLQGYCKGKKDGNYKHPKKCGSYIACASETAYFLVCPPGQSFLGKCNYCAPLKEVDCKAKQKRIGAYCDGKDDGFYRDPRNCAKYIRCVSGYVLGRDCQAGQGFTGRCNLCVPKDKVDCKDEITTVVPAPPPRPPSRPDPVPIPTTELPGPAGPMKKAFPTIPVIANCGTTNEDITTVGGAEAIPGSWGWQAAIYKKGRFVCGGALVSPKHVLTAAQCVPKGNPKGRIVVWLGDHARLEDDRTEQKIYAEQITHHATKDIAMIELSREVKVGDEVGMVCVPDNDQSLSDKDKCYTTGWTVVKPTEYSNSYLHEARVNVVSINKCKEKAKKKDIKRLLSKKGISCVHFTEYQNPACYGEAGGPLVCKKGKKWFLHGIHSRRVNKCKETNQYTAFTKVKRKM